MKQMLLVFDRIVFLDPVDDLEWRAKLFRDLERAEDSRFRRFRNVHAKVTDLANEGVIERADPLRLQSLQAMTTSASIISDLIDSNWVRIAASPQSFGMPHRNLSPRGTPTWQIFEDKMPTSFVTALQAEESMNRHLIIEGDRMSSWTLSYEAGSACAINVHLAAAEELGLAPITDSLMHHQLLLLKLFRKTGADTTTKIADDGLIQQIAHRIAVDLISEIMPEHELETLTFDDLMEFRHRTSEVRGQAIREISSAVGSLARAPEMADVLSAQRQIGHALNADIRKYQAEIQNVRDKLWPHLISSVNTSLATGGVAAMAMAYIGGPGHAIAASIGATSLAILKTTLDLTAERKKLERSTSPAVTYLSQIGKKLGNRC